MTSEKIDFLPFILYILTLNNVKFEFINKMI